MSARLLPRKKNARPAAALPQGEPWWVGAAFVGFSLLFCMLLAQTALGAPLWTHKPPSDIKWYRVTDVGSLLVGSKGALYALDGETGKEVWSRADLAGAEEFEVDTIPGTPLLFVSDTSGTFKKGTRLFALDLLSGQNIWETEKLKGATVAVEPVYEKDLVLLVTVENNSAGKARPRIAALWYYDRASESITNMAVLPETNTVLVADAKSLIGLDAAGSGKVKESYKVKLEFKNNLGAAGTAAKVAKFGFGGLGAIGKGGGDDRDEPVALYRRENGTVVVAGKQHLRALAAAPPAEEKKN